MLSPNVSSKFSSTVTSYSRIYFGLRKKFFALNGLYSYTSSSTSSTFGSSRFSLVLHNFIAIMKYIIREIWVGKERKEKANEWESKEEKETLSRSYSLTWRIEKENDGFYLRTGLRRRGKSAWDHHRFTAPIHAKGIGKCDWLWV